MARNKFVLSGQGSAKFFCRDLLAQTSLPAMHRITSIDFVRGLVMVIMALDHTRDLLHITGMSNDPTDLSTTTPGLFFTRWITHLCAPTFVFLAGLSSYLAVRSAPDKKAARRLLLTRGLWLMILELTIINLGMWFDIRFHTYVFQVIFAIGFGMLMMSFLSRWSANTLGIIGLLIIFFHGLIPPAPETIGDIGKFFWSLLFKFNVFFSSPERAIMVIYPVIPWLGIMLFGYACGQLYESGVSNRPQKLLGLAGAALLLFVFLRTFNLYGDPNPWAPRGDGLFSFLSFINVSKYPPSLLYTAVLLSIMFLLLAAFERINNPITRFFTVYGKVPLFYYIVHWYMIHTIMVVTLHLTGHPWYALPTGPINFGRPVTGWGFDLPGVYLVWAGVVLTLYPLCRWFGQYKHQHSQQKWWLRYM